MNIESCTHKISDKPIKASKSCLVCAWGPANGRELPTSWGSLYHYFCSNYSWCCLYGSHRTCLRVICSHWSEFWSLESPKVSSHLFHGQFLLAFCLTHGRCYSVAHHPWGAITVGLLSMSLCLISSFQPTFPTLAYFSFLNWLVEVKMFKCHLPCTSGPTLSSLSFPPCISLHLVPALTVVSLVTVTTCWFSASLVLIFPYIIFLWKVPPPHLLCSNEIYLHFRRSPAVLLDPTHFCLTVE